MNEKQIIWATVIGIVLLLGGGGYVAIKMASPKPEPKKVAVDTTATPAKAVVPKPAAPATPTPEQLELQRLRAENERLKRQQQQQQQQQAAQVATQVTPPTQPPPPVATTGSIGGSIWLTNDSGGSDLMRGLGVRIVTKTIPAAMIAQAAIENIPDWEREIKRLGERIDDEKRSKASSERMVKDHGDPWPQLIKMNEKQIAKMEMQIAQHKKLIEAIRNMPSAPADVVDTLTGYTALVASEQYGFARLPTSRTTVVREGRTDVEGKYKIDGIPPGNYYVHAFFDSKSHYIEWLVPLTIRAGDAISMDLFNDNAANIKNN